MPCSARDRQGALATILIAGASIAVGAVTAAVLVRRLPTPLPPPELRLSLPEIEGGGRAVARPPPQPGAPAEHRAGEDEQRGVDLGIALIADPQAPEVVQVRKAALDDPAVATESGAVLGATPGDHRLDVALRQQSAVLVVVIAAIGDHGVGLLTRPADLPSDRPGVQVI